MSKALKSLKIYSNGNSKLREAYNLLTDQGQYKLLRLAFDGFKMFHEAKIYER